MGDFLRFDVEGGEEADGIGSGGGDEESVFGELVAEVDGREEAVGGGEVGVLESEAEEESPASQLADAGMFP